MFPRLKVLHVDGITTFDILIRDDGYRIDAAIVKGRGDEKFEWETVMEYKHSLCDHAICARVVEEIFK